MVINQGEKEGKAGTHSGRGTLGGPPKAHQETEGWGHMGPPADKKDHFEV